MQVRMDRQEKPYTVSHDTKGDFWYCHKRGYAYIPVFGSIGDKKTAQRICRTMNKSVGREK